MFPFIYFYICKHISIKCEATSASLSSCQIFNAHEKLTFNLKIKYELDEYPIIYDSLILKIIWNNISYSKNIFN